MNFKPHLVQTKNPNGTPVNTPPVSPVTKYMVPLAELVVFRGDQNLYDVMHGMIDNRISGAPVLDDTDAFIGIISEKDCLRLMLDVAYNQQEKPKAKAVNYMTRNIATVHQDETILDVAEKFVKSSYRRYPVVDNNGKLIGQVSRRDILRAALTMKV